MKRFIFFLIGVFLVSFVFAGVDTEIGRLTYYAEEYEVGNIDYPQFVVGISSARENLNELFGAVSNFEGGLLRQEDIEKVLGEPTEMTKWVWVEGEDREKKVDEEVPVWKKNVFDGKKIRILLEIHPSIWSSKKFQGEEDEDFYEEYVGQVIYRLHFNVEFKDKEEAVDFDEEVEEMTEMAEDLSRSFSEDLFEELALKAVGVENFFGRLIWDRGEDCEDLMGEVFESQDIREVQQVEVWEIEFVESEKFDSYFVLEMCEECQWNWINLDLRVHARDFYEKQGEFGDFYEKYKGLTEDAIRSELTRLVDEARVSLEGRDFGKAADLANRIRALSNVWNEKSNNVWEQIDGQFEARQDLMSEEERREFNDNYGWIKLDQERRRAEEALKLDNYRDRKQFYYDLFVGYEKRTYSFEDKSWGKRLFEDFQIISREVCDNGKDDNDDGNIDCGDSMCGGSVCGKDKIGNETFDLFCIEGTCQAREFEVKKDVCGNHICEVNESVENCVQDCGVCVEHGAIECDGRVVFGGEDENGCPLEPICMEEDSCEVNSDCEFLCGEGVCVNGTCKVETLVECEEGCVEGGEKFLACDSGGKIVSEVCDGGIWKETGLACEGGVEVEEEIVDVECENVADCGGGNDVCSNGRCVTLPARQSGIAEGSQPETGGDEEEVVEEDQEIVEEVEEDQEEVVVDEVTGNVVSRVFTYVFGPLVTGKVVEEEGGSGEEVVEEAEEEIVEEVVEEDSVVDEDYDEPREEEFYEDDRGDEEDDRREREERDREREEERRRAEEKERCEKDCVRPCVEECIRDACGEEMRCDVDEERKGCEGTCEPEDSCVEKCTSGEDWWKDYEKEQVKENGVFSVGGNCRYIEGRNEGGIWFGAWGKVFEGFDRLKERYHSEGNNDWCKREFNNAVLKRAEFEKGMSDDFLVWFFEKYLANSAEDWEQANSGIYELYWDNVDNLRRMSENLGCMGGGDSVVDLIDYELINASYESDYGRLEYWEKVEVARLENGEEVEIISPYMRVWIFPPKEFIEFEMRRAMEEGRFPGSPEERMKRGNEGGLTSEEKEKIRENEKLMKKIDKITEEYGGEMEVVVRLVDDDKVVFNLDARVGGDDIFVVRPMLPENVSGEDVRVDVDFNLVYDFIYENEKEMRGEELVSPPWGEDKEEGFSVGKVVDGIKMYFEVRKIVNSAEYYPDEAKGDVKDLFWGVTKVMGDEGDGGKEEGVRDKGKEMDGEFVFGEEGEDSKDVFGEK